MFRARSKGTENAKLLQQCSGPDQALVVDSDELLSVPTKSLILNCVSNLENHLQVAKQNIESFNLKNDDLWLLSRFGEL